MTVAKNKSKWSQNRFAQASLLCAAVAVALTLAGATLQARPAIRNPEHAFAPVLSEDFQQSLSRANRQLQELAEAVDQYKMRHRRRFITFEELFEVVKSLGYHK